MTDNLQGILAQVTDSFAAVSELGDEVDFTHLSDGTEERYLDLAELAEITLTLGARIGKATWVQFMSVGFFTIAGAEDVSELRQALVDMAAVCVKWVDSIDRREQEADEQAEADTEQGETTPYPSEDTYPDPEA